MQSSRSFIRGRLNIYGVDFDRNLNQVYNNYTFIKDEENLEFIVISEAQKVLANLELSAKEEQKEIKNDESRIKRILNRLFRKKQRW